MNITNNTWHVFFAYLLAYMISMPLLVNDVQAKDNVKNKQKVNKASIQKKPEPSLAKLHFTASDKKQDLPDSVLKVLKKYKIPKDNLSIYVRNLNASQALIEHNADKIRSPASTMKLLTTYAALKELGPNYSWRTEVWMRGDFNKHHKGVLKGDLILKGYGDPFLVYENFYKLLRTLRDKGLHEIQGNVIVDNSYFDLPLHNPAAFDGKPYRIYNAASSALMFNFQATRFLFRPVVSDKVNKTGNKKGKPAKNKKAANKGYVDIIPYPAIKQFGFKNEVKLTRGKCRKSHYRPVFSKDKKGKLTIKGNYAKKCGQQFILRAVSKPEEHVFNAFREIWGDLKGRHTGGFKWGRIKKGDERFHVYSSPTLGTLMRLINKWSNNVMTRQVFLTLGAKKYGAPGTPEKAKRAVLEILSENLIDTKGIVLENGSGLSRSARISARQMASLLEMAYRDPMMPEFMASLSIPGVDGTLVNRFRKDDIRGRSHFKTGTLTGVSAIAGYMLNRQGKWLLIVIQQNGKKTGGGRSRKVQDALLRWSFEQ
jgi:D-alanyl-D-alanine carboxypeptidase/D-alanyl-D-alanine-endopeptidase (penicillin-binding protein 4)